MRNNVTNKQKYREIHRMIERGEQYKTHWRKDRSVKDPLSLGRRQRNTQRQEEILIRKKENKRKQYTERESLERKAEKVREDTI